MSNVGYRLESGWLQKPPLGVQLNRAHPLAKGLVGCWPFNEGGGDKAYDLSGYGNHGTLKNMAFPPTITSGWNPGRNGMVLNFGGTNDYIDCGANASLNLGASDIPHSLELRFKRADSDTNQFLLRKSGAPGSGNNCVFLAFSTVSPVNRLRMNLYDGVNDRNWYTNTVFNDKKWHHVVATRVNTVISLYVDGVLETSSSQTLGDCSNPSAPLRIGSMKDDGYFAGSIDYVKIYNREVIANEIQHLYIDPYCIFEPISTYALPTFSPVFAEYFKRLRA